MEVLPAVSFPTELKPFIKTFFKESWFGKIKMTYQTSRLMYEDNRIQQGFNSWLAQHEHLGVKSPTIRQLKITSIFAQKNIEIYNSFNNKIYAFIVILVYAVVAQIFESIFGLLTVFRFNLILTLIEAEKLKAVHPALVARDLDLIIEYLDLEMIDLDQVAILLKNEINDITPLLYNSKWESLTRLLERFFPDRVDLLTEIFCHQTQKTRKSPLFGIQVWVSLLPILKKYIPSHLAQLEKCLTGKDNDGIAPIDLNSEIPEINELLKDYLPNHVDALVSLLMKKENLSELISLLENFVPNQMEKLADILSRVNQSGSLALFGNFEKFLPLLKSFTPNHEDLLIKILSVSVISNAHVVVLRTQDAAEVSLPWLESLIPSNISLLVQILSIWDKDFPVFLQKKFKPLLYKFRYSHPKEFLRLMSIQNAEGKTIFHNNTTFAQSLLKNRSNSKFAELLSIADCNGDVPLHKKNILNQWKERMELAKLTSLLGITNKEGLSVRECSEYQLSKEWLNSQKHSDEVYTDYTPEDYQVIASLLETRIGVLWNNLSFSEDGSTEYVLNRELLSDGGKHYKPVEISEALTEIFSKIKKKETWPGAPLSSQELNKFYHVMLNHLNELVTQLELKQNDAEAADCLIGIASTHLQKRPAIACQAVIRQKKLLIKGDSYEGLMKASATVALVTYIGRIVNYYYSNDPETMNTFLFAAGLIPEMPQQTPSSSVVDAIDFITFTFNLPAFYRDFAKCFPINSAIEWLNQVVRESARPDTNNCLEIYLKALQKLEIILRDNSIVAA